MVLRRRPDEGSVTTTSDELITSSRKGGLPHRRRPNNNHSSNRYGSTAKSHSRRTKKPIYNPDAPCFIPGQHIYKYLCTDIINNHSSNRYSSTAKSHSRRTKKQIYNPDAPCFIPGQHIYKYLCTDIINNGHPHNEAMATRQTNIVTKPSQQNPVMNSFNKSIRSKGTTKISIPNIVTKPSQQNPVMNSFNKSIRSKGTTKISIPSCATEKRMKELVDCMINYDHMLILLLKNNALLYGSLVSEIYILGSLHLDLWSSFMMLTSWFNQNTVTIVMSPKSAYIVQQVLFSVYRIRFSITSVNNSYISHATKIPHQVDDKKPIKVAHFKSFRHNYRIIIVSQLSDLDRVYDIRAGRIFLNHFHQQLTAIGEALPVRREHPIREVIPFDYFFSF